MIQLKAVRLEDLVFLDIETARTQKELIEGTNDYNAWEYQRKRYTQENDLDLVEDYVANASLFAEFSRVICISVGMVVDGVLRIVTYKDNSEKDLLHRFMYDLDGIVGKRPDARLAGHNVKGFDIPFVFKRCLVNGIVPNRLIDVGGAKPWELTAIDTKELWKGTGYYNASLVAICLAMGIESPKSDISGAEVAEVYFNEGAEGFERIVKYCEKDVLALANVIKKLRFEEIFDEYESVEPRPKVELGVIERIAKSGMVSDAESKELLGQAQGESIEEKEKLIKILRAALAVTKNELSQELELQILSA